MKTANIYRVFPNLTAWRNSIYPVFEGSHRWKLPSIRCPVCGVVWGELSVAYPHFDGLSIPKSKICRGNVVCVKSPSELEEARKPIAALLPSAFPLPPATKLGPFKGRHAAGKLEDFNLYLGLHMVSGAVYERLRAQGVLTVGATPALIRPKKKGEVVEFVELHLVPRAELAVPKVQKPGEKYCPACGFDQRSLPEPLVIHQASVPADEEIFLLKDDPGVILAKEPFVEAVKSLDLTGIEFRPGELV